MHSHLYNPQAKIRHQAEHSYRPQSDSRSVAVAATSRWAGILPRRTVTIFSDPWEAKDLEIKHLVQMKSLHPKTREIEIYQELVLWRHEATAIDRA